MRPIAKAALFAIPVCMVGGWSVRAQDFPDVQSMVSETLFRGRAAADERQSAERRRMEALDQRAQQQAAMLEEQAIAVQKLTGELQNLREERQLIGLAEAFDAAVGSGRWSLARSFLADTVTIDLPGWPGAGLPPRPADAVITDLSSLPGEGGVLPRSNQQVRFDGERTVLTSDGYAWRRPARSQAALRRDFGEYEYRFRRTATGWKIDGLSFRPRQPSG